MNCFSVNWVFISIQELFILIMSLGVATDENVIKTTQEAESHRNSGGKEASGKLINNRKHRWRTEFMSLCKHMNFFMRKVPQRKKKHKLWERNKSSESKQKFDVLQLRSQSSFFSARSLLNFHTDDKRKLRKILVKETIFAIFFRAFVKASLKGF